MVQKRLGDGWFREPTIFLQQGGAGPLGCGGGGGVDERNSDFRPQQEARPPSAFILLQPSGGPDVFIEDPSLDETRQNEQRSVVFDIICLSLPILLNNLGRDATETCETLRLKKKYYRLSPNCFIGSNISD